MNRFLTIPLVLFLCVFAGACLKQSQSSRASEFNDTTKSLGLLSEITNVENQYSSKPTSIETKLLDVKSAETLVKKKIDEQHSNYRMMSRAMVMPAKVITVKFDQNLESLILASDEPAETQFFLGSVTLERREVQTVFPIAVDRTTSNIYVYSNSSWVAQAAWNPR